MEEVGTGGGGTGGACGEDTAGVEEVVLLVAGVEVTAGRNKENEGTLPCALTPKEVKQQTRRAGWWPLKQVL